MPAPRAHAVAVSLMTAATALTAVPAAAAPPAGQGGCGRTVEVAVRTDGQPVAIGAWWPSISADGTRVVFASETDSLTDDDGNGTTDVYLHDLRTRTTTLVSRNRAGVAGNGYSAEPELSGDGRHLAFLTFATNLVPADTDDLADVVVRDLRRRTNRLVSVGADGRPVGGRTPTISHDGGRVAYVTPAAVVPADTNGVEDVYVRDLRRGTTRLVSASAAGVPGDSSAREPAISADGRYVAFTSRAANLVPGDTNRIPDIFVKDLSTGAIERASLVQGTNAETPTAVARPSISADGSRVAFESDARLSPDDTDGNWDVFVRDLRAGTTRRVSTGTHGEIPDGASYNATISADGSRVAFESETNSLVPGDVEGTLDVLVKDLGTGVLRLGAVSSCGEQSNGSSESPSLSADGRSIAFSSRGTNLAPTVQGPFGVFVHRFR
jgi:Tol biopolymer transport system component